MALEKSWHKSYAPGVPQEIEFERVTMPEALTRNAKQFSNHTALLYMGKKIFYPELERLVNRFGRALMDMGVKKGDKVAMLLPNIPQIVIANYATFRIGAVAVMNNPLYTERELEYQLNDSDSKILVTLDLLLPRALILKGKTKIEKIITCHINDYLPFPKKQLFPMVKKQMYRKVEAQKNVYQFLDLIKKYPDGPLENAAGWDDLAAFIYTGGTTGVSKGVMLTHSNLSCNVQQFGVWFPDLKKGEESVLAVFPFFHSAGFTAIQNYSLWAGFKNILLPRPEPGSIIEMLKKFRPHFLPAVPTIFVGLLNSEEFRKMDLSFIKGFFSGAAPLAADTIQQLKDLTGATMLEVYGLTETAPIATATPWGGKIKPGTVGVPVPNTDVKVVDVETGKEEMKQGVPGEVIIKGPQVMKGYWPTPGKGLVDGWLPTGDIARMDEDGYFYIVDRKKDMANISGYKVYTTVIDDILFQHPAVSMAAAIGIPDPERPGSERLKAFVKLKDEYKGKVSAEDIIEHCRAKCPPYAVPKFVEFREDLYFMVTEKLFKKALRDEEIEKMKAAGLLK